MFQPWLPNFLITYSNSYCIPWRLENESAFWSVYITHFWNSMSCGLCWQPQLSWQTSSLSTYRWNERPFRDPGKKKHSALTGSCLYRDKTLGSKQQASVLHISFWEGWVARMSQLPPGTEATLCSRGVCGSLAAFSTALAESLLPFSRREEIKPRAEIMKYKLVGLPAFIRSTVRAHYLADLVQSSQLNFPLSETECEVW